MIRNLLLISITLLLSACAGKGSGILIQFDENRPFDQVQLERTCDLEDATACLLFGKPIHVELPRLAITQGVAPPGRAIFAALLEQPHKAKWFYREKGAMRLKGLTPHQQQTFPGSPFRLEIFLANDLVPEKEYELLGVNELGQLIDQRFFRTLSATNLKIRFAMIASTDDFSIDQEMWRDLEAQNPDLIFALGNNVYANSRGAEEIGDTLEPAQVWARYVEARSRLPIFKNPRLVPVIATWNDHDYGMIDGDQSYAHADTSRQAMEAFFPYLADNKYVLEGPGLAHGLRISEQTFLLFDNRSFRNAKKGEEASYLGRLQSDWLLSLTKTINGPIWLFSGERWFGANEPSFERAHPAKFVSLLAELALAGRTRSKGGTQVSFLYGSAAESRAEIRNIPSARSYEFSASFQKSLGAPQKHKASLAAASGGYLLVASERERSGGLAITAEARDSSGSLFKKELNLGTAKKKR